MAASRDLLRMLLLGVFRMNKSKWKCHTPRFITMLSSRKCLPLLTLTSGHLFIVPGFTLVSCDKAAEWRCLAQQHKVCTCDEERAHAHKTFASLPHASRRRFTDENPHQSCVVEGPRIPTGNLNKLQPPTDLSEIFSFFFLFEISIAQNSQRVPNHTNF